MSPDATVRHEVADLDAAKVHTPASNKKVTPEDVTTLLPSIEKDGQLIPGVAYPHPTLPGNWLCADGNHRLLVCRLLCIPFKAIVLKEAPTEEQLIKIRVTANFHRRNVTAYELAGDIQRWIALKQANQKQAAAFFGMSEPQVSKILAKAENAIAEVVQAEKDGKICGDVGRLISTLPKEKQVQALEHVLKMDMKRDRVEVYVAGLKGLKQPTIRPVTATDGDATLRFPANWTFQKIIEFAVKIQEAAKQGLKVPGLGVMALPALLKPAQS